MRKFLLLIALLPVAAWAVTSPKQFFGFDVCDDYRLANYTQLEKYWKQLDKESDRLKLVSIGKSEEGREQWMAIISDPANIRHLDEHRRNSERIARANSFTSSEEIEKLTDKAKAVVWIDGGLHATETLGAQQLIETSYQLITRNDEETRRILRDCIVLMVHANPDGMELVSNWYMRKTDPKERSFANLPVLYEKYAGHDNNRDFYASNLKETENMNRILYSVWYPQIVYNHHQTAPSGTVIFIPPFRNPYNHNVDAITQVGTDVVGIHMHQRLVAKGLGGSVMRNGANYSTWWNGGLRTTTYFHNMVGILTEAFGSPTPARIPFVPNRQIPITDLPLPVAAGEWHMKQSLQYELEANYAILDYASRFRKRLLMNVFTAARNSIERGSRDNWTPYPSRITEFGENLKTRLDLRDARMYVLPMDQPDKGSVRWFVDRLLKVGIEVGVLKSSLMVNGKTIEKGSYVVRCDQAFRPHILDMFEPQDHPNDFQFPGGPPIPPYDNAGYTLAYQMGVQFERVLDPVAVDVEPVTALQSLAVEKLNTDLNSADIDVFRQGNLLSKTGKHVRVGLWDRFGGSMESGWIRWLLEKFGFDFKVLYPPDFEKGGLDATCDVLLLPSGAIPTNLSRGDTGDAARNDELIPLEFRQRMGGMSQSAIGAIQQFVQRGGRVVAIGSSTLNLAKHLGIQVENGLTKADGTSFSNTEFYVPGSVLSVKLNPSKFTEGFGDRMDVMFDNSPAFRLASDQIEPIAVFDSAKPLRSGWAWGQERLQGLTAIARVRLGKGDILLCGPELLFRAQPSGSMRLVFRAILDAAKTSAAKG
ncbi:MAG: M14 metallopeptidase family protein [Fimbriimonadales bacterium]